MRVYLILLCIDTGNTNNDQKSFGFNAYQRNESPWDSYKRKYKLTDNSSCSTLESTCSSRSDSPEPSVSKTRRKHSKKKYQMLRREIRKLRGENQFLRSSVSVLKNDLRDSTISRQNADIIHQRIFQEYDQRHKSLEQEILDKSDQVHHLKEQIERLQLRSLSNDSHRNDSVHHRFGCYDQTTEAENEIMSCQPVPQESALPELNIKMDELKTDQASGDDYFRRRQLEGKEDNEQEEEEEEDDEQNDPALESFETAASSYIHQAIIAKLSCARVRLDFDDLIVKHDPSNDTIMSVLANAFVYWLHSQYTKPESKSISGHQFFTLHVQPGIDDFWKSILQCYGPDDEGQVCLLHHIENALKRLDSKDLLNHLSRLLYVLIKYEVVEIDSVFTWYANPLIQDELSTHARDVCKNLIEYLDSMSDEEEEEEEEEDDEEEEESDDDDEYEYTHSTIPEEDDEDVGFVFAHDNEDEDEDDDEESSLRDSIEDFLTNKERNPCICQFNYDNDTNDSPFPSHPSSPTSGKHELPECSCDSTYSNPATEKKKKSVRIQM